MAFKTGLAAAFLAFAALSTSVQAQQAPAPGAEAAAPAAQRAVRTAKKKAAAKNATEVVFLNARSGAVVTGATLTSAGGKTAGLKQPLAPGKKVSVKLPKGAGCVFALNASFSDDGEFDQTEVNLCTDKTVRFTD